MPEPHAIPVRPAHKPRRGFAGLILLAFIAVWIALGISPGNRDDWLLENVIVAIAIPTLVWSHRRVPLSNFSYLGIFLFGILHEVGAHYTYAEVPYDLWMRAVLGTSPGQWLELGRNHYDRVVHFFYGLLITPAAMELIEARASPRGWWRWLLPVTFICSHALLYELLEWAAAMTFSNDLRLAYLATQGDPWDAQHDMAQALAGSAISATVLLLFRRR